MGKKVLTAEQRVSIRKQHKRGVSVRGLSIIYGVSRGTIRFVLNPHLEQENRERSKLRQRELRSETNNNRDNSK